MIELRVREKEPEVQQVAETEALLPEDVLKAQARYYLLVMETKDTAAELEVVENKFLDLVAAHKEERTVAFNDILGKTLNYMADPQLVLWKPYTALSDLLEANTEYTTQIEKLRSAIDAQDRGRSKLLDVLRKHDYKGAKGTHEVEVINNSYPYFIHPQYLEAFVEGKYDQVTRTWDRDMGTVPEWAVLDFTKYFL